MTDGPIDQKSTDRASPKKAATKKNSSPRQTRPVRPSRRTKSPRANDTRQKLVEATINTIYLDGFGNTSSSEVARRIGATWSVIQYHFGSWEALLLEALKELCDRNYEVIKATEISGDTVADRLMVFSNMIFDIYGRGRYGTLSQIAFHLLTHPKTHESTLEMMNYTVTRQDDALVALLAQVSPKLTSSRDLRNLVQYSLTGMAMSLEGVRALYRDVSATERHPDEKIQRTLLNKAIALLLEDTATAG